MINSEEILKLVRSNLDFVCYRLPQEKTVHTYFTKEAKTISFDLLGKENGFVIAPFENDGKYSIIPFENDASLLQKAGSYSFRPPTTATQKEDYLEQAEQFIRAMAEQKLQKAILSRILTVKIDQKTELPSLYQHLTEEYPSAFVYWFRTKSLGMWMGATPEQFLNSENNLLKTVSLAGTQPNQGEISWSEKEIQEQQFVSDYIASLYEATGISYVANGPKTVSAGPVAHLKTYFESSQNLTADQLSDFALKLHPTPAVGGLPKKEAVDLIQQHEKHQRECYCGFLGPVHHQEVNLFVNLRCMQIFKEQLALYVGGGLTKDSVPEQEWQETVEKAKTLLAIIDPSQKTNE